ncbi:MAG TPA: hypothetical protein VKV17_22080 [Bryobacteraceae bacterium]|nr:hypothetical protein [Bryobacteraceae bacterium]
MRFFLLLPAWLPLLAQTENSQILSRVAEEAEVLRQNLPNALSEETLEQRAWLPASRFRSRAGGAGQSTPRLLVRTVVSEYTVAPLQGAASPTLVEYREVVSVDGQAVRSEKEARHALTLGTQSLDDRLRKRMLEDFAQHGLVDVATDYGLILLEFTGSGQRGLEIRPAGRGLVGAEDALIYSWKQKSAETGELEFIGRQAERHALTGRLWVRASDGVPLRVEAVAEHIERKHRIRDEARVEYTTTARGFLAPASVLHQHIVDRQLLTENRYTYAPFKIFAADAEVDFTGQTEPALGK